MITEEVTDIRPHRFHVVGKVFTQDEGGGGAAPTPTTSKVTFNDSDTPEIINTVFTTPWSAI